MSNGGPYPDVIDFTKDRIIGEGGSDIAAALAGVGAFPIPASRSVPMPEAFLAKLRAIDREIAERQRTLQTMVDTFAAVIGLDVENENLSCDIQTGVATITTVTAVPKVGG